MGTGKMENWKIEIEIEKAEIGFLPLNPWQGGEKLILLFQKKK